MTRKKLALLGGAPIRTSAFASRPYLDERELAAVTEVLSSGAVSQFVGSPIPGTRDVLGAKSHELENLDAAWSFVGGPRVRSFESAWSREIGSDYSISVNSATSGLITALLALELEPGSEVITTPFSFTATAAAIVLAHCVPVFIDIDPETFCLCPDALARAVTSNTKAVVPVHWCGNAGDFSEILAITEAHGLRVIEDAAQVPATWYEGRALGTYGDLGVFSFNQPKNVMTGEGGIVVTNDQYLAEKCRLIRNHGEAIVDDDDPDQYVANSVGYNFRLTELQAAIGFEQIAKIQEINDIRAANYEHLSGHIQTEFSDFLEPQRITHPDSYYAYTAAFRWYSDKHGVHRDSVAKALRAEGIPVFTGYQRLLSDHPMFKRKIAAGLGHYPWDSAHHKGQVDYSQLELPNARKLVGSEFLGFLQMGWPNTPSDMDDILRAFEKIIDNIDDLLALENSVSPSFDLGK